MTGQPGIKVGGVPAPTGRVRSHLPEIGTWGPVFAFVLVIIVFGFLKGDLFLRTSNLFAILNDNAVLAIVTFGLTVVLLTGEFDLSIAGIMTLSAMLSAGFVSIQQWPTVVAVVMVLLIGLVIGWINGALVVYFGIHALIATLAVGSILGGFSLYYSNGETIYQGIPQSFLDLGRASVGRFTAPIIYMVLIGIFLWAMLRYTAAGRYFHAIGGNREAARLSGIRVNRYVIAAFMTSGVCAAFAGMVQAARNGSADPTSGATYLLPAFAAAFLGSATLRRGQFHIVGSVIGVYLIATATSGFFLVGAPFYTQEFLAGGLLILATASARFLKRRGPGPGRLAVIRTWLPRRQFRGAQAKRLRS